MIAFNRDYREFQDERPSIRTRKTRKPNLNSDSPNLYERLYGPLSEEGKALANLLAKDNFLYNDLVYIFYRSLPTKEEDRMDLLQDFFLNITKYADTFKEKSNETFIGVDNLKDYEYGKNWLIKSLRNFVGVYWKGQYKRIRKEPNKPRAKEFRAFQDKEGGSGRLSAISYEIYLRNKGEQFPGRKLLEQEEKEEFEYNRRMVKQIIEDAMKRLTKSEREVVRLYYFEGLSLDEIAKKKIQVEFHMKDCYITNGSARTHLWSARKKLSEILPPEICSTVAWIRGDYRVIELAA